MSTYGMVNRKEVLPLEIYSTVCIKTFLEKVNSHIFVFHHFRAVWDAFIHFPQGIIYHKKNA